MFARNLFGMQVALSKFFSGSTSITAQNIILGKTHDSNQCTTTDSNSHEEHDKQSGLCMLPMVLLMSAVCMTPLLNKVAS